MLYLHIYLKMNISMKGRFKIQQIINSLAPTIKYTLSPKILYVRLAYDINSFGQINTLRSYHLTFPATVETPAVVGRVARLNPEVVSVVDVGLRATSRQHRKQRINPRRNFLWREKEKLVISLLHNNSFLDKQIHPHTFIWNGSYLKKKETYV